MTTNIVKTDFHPRKHEFHESHLSFSRPVGVTVCWCALLLFTLCLQVSASTVFGPWIPMFKGIDHAMGTNTPGVGAFAELQVVNALRVDLTDPDVRFFSTPRYANYVPDGSGTCGSETIVLTATNFLTRYGLQLAINANNFHDPCTSDSPSYTLPQGTPVRVTGALVSTGQVVSVQEAPIDNSTFLFSSNNVPTFVPTNWPARSTVGAYTVVS